MGLIDNIRKERDSWVKRFEEHRQDDDEQKGKTQAEIDSQIAQNRRNVGVFPKVQDPKK